MEWIAEKEVELTSGRPLCLMLPWCRLACCCHGVDLHAVMVSDARVTYLKLSAEDFGHDQGSVMVLLRKHQTLERDLAVLGAKLEQVFAEVRRISGLSFSYRLTYAML